MKNVVLLLIGSALLHLSITNYANNISRIKTVTGSNRHAEHSISILCTGDMYPLTKTWVSGYSKVHPEVNIEVVQLPDYQKAHVLSTEANLLVVSDKYLNALNDNPKWKMVLGREAIIPVISSKNPFMDKIDKRGISSDELAQIGSNTEKLTWGTLLGNNRVEPVHCYMINDESLKSQVADFMKANPVCMDRLRLVNPKDMISAIQKDPYGLGFCRMIDLLDFKNQEIVENITLLPFDKNRNGRLDYFEKIYSDLKVFTRGVWIGKYPEALCRTIYAISSAKPTNEHELAFLSWIITNGQQFLYPVGYQDLANSDRNVKNLEMLKSNQPEVNMASRSGLFPGKLNSVSIFAMIAIALIPFILIFMVRDALVRNRQYKGEIINAVLVSSAVFDENTVNLPKGLFFDKTHTWAFMEKNGLVRIGIDDFLQHITGPLTGIKMRNAGEKVQKGDQLISIIQNGKQLTIHAPISGIIKAQNTTLIANSSAMNSSPYADGWVYMIEPTKWLSEIRVLAMAENYKDWIRTEFARLKDFLAASIKANNIEFPQIILQDGGALKDGILADLGPKLWEDFQIEFIERSK